MTPQAEPFQHFPFNQQSLNSQARSHAYVVYGSDGSKARIEATSVSAAILQSGIANPVRAKRMDPMGQTILGLKELGLDQAPEAHEESPAPNLAPDVASEEVAPTI